ncbi:BA75_04604T0 [Komagataella pastoris]|uniref:Mediator of RNA polymerase II transcription subunit 18 n=1 Tax=Komagataella pastoris TaxID=4922 RepID=A0A1B2JHF0_PICPA|nr:BA75_04604T0 [Komagataella pastoris]
MVQQVSLVSSIQQSQLQLILETLKSLTGMVPARLSTYTVVLTPKFPYSPEFQTGKVNQIEQYKMRMTTEWKQDVEEPIDNTIELKDYELFNKNHLEALNKENRIWTLQISDVPLAGKRAVSSQTLYESTICSTDDVVGYLDELGYMPETQFWTHGYKFYRNDIVIAIYRVFMKQKQDSAPNSKENTAAATNGSTRSDTAIESKNTDDMKIELDMDIDMKMDVDTNAESNPETKEETIEPETRLELIDKSKEYFIKAYVNVAKMSDVENLSRATSLLEHLKSELEGLIEFSIPNRASMDSRIGSRLASSI